MGGCKVYLHLLPVDVLLDLFPLLEPVFKKPLPFFIQTMLNRSTNSRPTSNPSYRYIRIYTWTFPRHILVEGRAEPLNLSSNIFRPRCLLALNMMLSWTRYRIQSDDLSRRKSHVWEWSKACQNKEWWGLPLISVVGLMQKCVINLVLIFKPRLIVNSDHAIRSSWDIGSRLSRSLWISLFGEWSPTLSICSGSRIRVRQLEWANTHLLILSKQGERTYNTLHFK